MKNVSLGYLTLFLWPVIILILGIIFLFILSGFFSDMNKVNAAAQAANCQIALQSPNEQQKICKEIFDSARREPYFLFF